MSSAFLAITDAIVAALVASPAVAGGRVLRGRASSVSAEHASAVRVTAQRHQGSLDSLAGTSLQWKSIIAVDVFARCAADSDAEATLDPLLVATWARVAAIDWPTSVEDVTVIPAIVMDVDEADATVASAAFSIRVTHHTDTTTLAAAG